MFLINLKLIFVNIYRKINNFSLFSKIENVTKRFGKNENIEKLGMGGLKYWF